MKDEKEHLFVWCEEVKPVDLSDSFMDKLREMGVIEE